MLRCLTRKTVPLFLLSIFLSVIFLSFGLFIPIRLNIQNVPEPFYADVRLDGKNVSVEYETLFGVSIPAEDIYGRQSVNGYVQLWSRGLSFSKSYDVIYPRKTRVEYIGDGVYVGQKADVSDFLVTAVYDDCERQVLWFEIDDEIIAMESEAKISVRTMYGVTDVVVPTIQPSGLKADYVGDCAMGSTFDRNCVQVLLMYPDGSSYPIYDFQIPDAPTYISDNMDVNVVTDYGDVSFCIKSNDTTKLTVSYTKPLYVGDVVDKNAIELKVDDVVVSSDSFEIDDIGIVKTKSVLLVKSEYGNVSLTIQPINIQSCDIVTSKTLSEGVVPTIESVSLTFCDGTVKDISLADCEFLNLSEHLVPGMSDIWLSYKGLRLCDTVCVIPNDVVALRPDITFVNNVSTYDLTDEQISNIAILCQRFVSDDLQSVAREVSLMANRYELYGSNFDFWNYIVDSGYWGSDLESYMTNRQADERVSYVVRDVLCNGYRHLPLYVDSRCEFRMMDSIVLQDGDFIRDANGSVYMFYDNVSVNSNYVYACTEYAYQILMNETFDIKNVYDYSYDFVDVSSDDVLHIFE